MSITVRDLRAFKAQGRRFAMLTAYDYPTAQILDEAGIPVLLVGDSLAQTILGYDTTLPVTMEEMLHHTRAVARGATKALIVGDMPFLSYQVSIADGVANAGRFLKEGGAHAVKIEGWMPELVEQLSTHGIPVMAHLGLTPQSVHAMGGYRVQGRSEEDAHRLLEQAMGMEKAGAFSLVLEGIPSDLGREITRSLDIPTIGIGAGPDCDGQVLVLTDLLGMNSGHYPKFAKPYANLRGEISKAVIAFANDVEGGAFPDEEHSYR
ncbi:MAG TPA: 3-methyl-2-oxobutanoate hydroxymethyltransferase [Actinomycetota bacterium]|jgi:3-methyl-2-oxobutanoate hydroxymethyltransferase